ncbi:hypothetical protein TspCOW1_05330 [Thiohalobacter sp. COW1]|uniref:hypothetical protein n=1 Tax=Thiohalobacter sp. COW1 TaxID=2795687 RepID=UPI0019165BC4|nr:hypothetical protein [Thiohalobacter sp. COW1]BCO30430.1 hypothetical protein TspCOW1_05330 [Thiohalobacter sp. COW1]
MGFFRNIKITNMAFQASYKGMKLMSAMRKSDPDMAPSAEEAIESLGDELAILSREYCTSEKERACLIKGLDQGLKAYGLSQTATLNIVAALTPRIMAGKPGSALSDGMAEIMERNGTPENAQSKLDAAFKQTSLFMDASLMMIDNETLNLETPKVGAALYFAGATDFLAQHYKLSDEDYLKVLFDVLRKFGLSEKNASLFVQHIPEMSNELFGREAMIEGGKTLQRWLSGKDDSAPVRLTELVNRWAEETI